MLLWYTNHKAIILLLHNGKATPRQQLPEVALWKDQPAVKLQGLLRRPGCHVFKRLPEVKWNSTATQTDILRGASLVSHSHSQQIMMPAFKKKQRNCRQIDTASCDTSFQDVKCWMDVSAERWSICVPSIKSRWHQDDRKWVERERYYAAKVLC